MADNKHTNRKHTIKRIAGLLSISARMDLAWLLRDTKYALIAIVADLVSNLSTVSGVFLIALRFDGIGGMNADEVLLMMGFSTVVTGLGIMLGCANNLHVSRLIGRGQMDHLFQQPVPLWMQLLTMGFMPWTGGGNFLAGLVLLGIAIHRLALPITGLWLLWLLLYLLAAFVILVARSYLVSSAAFYAPVAAEEIAYTVIDDTQFLSTFPLGGMPKWLQIPLIALPILPEGLLAWFPTMCLLGKPPLGIPGAYPLFFALMLSLLAGTIFRKGMNDYVKKGSNRYVPYGFRR